MYTYIDKDLTPQEVLEKIVVYVYQAQHTLNMPKIFEIQAWADISDIDANLISSKVTDEGIYSVWYIANEAHRTMFKLTWG